VVCGWIAAGSGAKELDAGGELKVGGIPNQVFISNYDDQPLDKATLRSALDALMDVRGDAQFRRPWRCRLVRWTGTRCWGRCLARA